MKLAFPYMGEGSVAYHKLATMLGHEAVPTLKPTQKTINIGVKYAPEFACFPLKVMLGTYIEAIEQGADTIVSSGGHGPCRAGFYGELHQKVLQSLKYDVDFVIFDSVFDNPRRCIDNVKKMKGNNSFKTVIYTARTVYRSLKLMDEIEKQLQKMRPYEAVSGTCAQIWKNLQKEIAQAYTFEAVDRLRKDTQEMVHAVELIPVPEASRLRIGIVGEIYVVMESSVNMEMEEKLLGLGCEVQRSQYLGDWVDFHLIPHRISKPHELEIQKIGSEYFPIGIGGHARENMGWIKYFAQNGFDGVVHILPFSCLPELMSQSIIPQVSKDLNMPVISFPMDEQSGLANNTTRIEAFIELIKAKKFGSMLTKKVV